MRNPINIPVLHLSPLQRTLFASLTTLLVCGVARPSLAGDTVVLVSGGPGTYNAADPNCDPRWDPFITAPLEQAKQKPPKVGITPPHQFFWLVFKPAYEARWTADLQADDARKEQVDAVKKAGFGSYVDLISARAKERRWNLIWIFSADEFWQALNNIQVPVDEFYYWGHADADLWLTIEHVSDAKTGQVIAVQPLPKYVVSRRDVVDHANLGRLFVGRFLQPPVFYGNNTAPFAQQWANHLRVTSIGFEGDVDFGQVQQNGGEVLLAGRIGAPPAASRVECRPAPQQPRRPAFPWPGPNR